MKFWFCFAILLEIISLSLSPNNLGAYEMFPSKTWEIEPPKSVGLDKAKLDQLKKYVGGRGCIIRYGRMVYTWDDYTRRDHVATVVQSPSTHFLLNAMELGKVSTRGRKASVWEPRPKKIDEGLYSKDRYITCRHMANRLPCYGVTHKPDTAFAYNDLQMALFFDTIFLNTYETYRRNVDDTTLHPLLTDVIWRKDNPSLRAFGTNGRAGRLPIFLGDFTRFGLICLHKENWKVKQHIDKELALKAAFSPLPHSISKATRVMADLLEGQRSMSSRRTLNNQCKHKESYSWLWWLNGIDRRGYRRWPDVPPETYGAFDHTGRRAMVVIPTLDLIISWNDAKVRSRETVNKALGLAFASVKDISPRAGQIVVDTNHPAWFKPPCVRIVVASNESFV